MITVTATRDLGADEPRIRVDITTTAALPNPVASSALFALFRVHADGRQRRVIADADSRLIGGAATVYDYHAPFNQPVTYVLSASGYLGTSSSVTQVSTVSWLQHPTNPMLSVPILKLYDFGDTTRPSTSVVTRAFGSSEGVSQYDGARGANSGQLGVIVESEGKKQALDDLFDDDGPVLWNPATPDAAPAWWPQDWAWMQPGTITTSDPVKSLSGALRFMAIPYEVIATPEGAVVPVWDCGDVEDTYATCGDVEDTYSSCGNLETNTTGNAATGSITPDPATPGLFLPIGITPDPVRPGLFLLPG